VHLEHVLRDVQTNRANLFHGWLLLGGSSYDTANLAHRDAGGGAVHSINNGLSDQRPRRSALHPTTDIFGMERESPLSAVDSIDRCNTLGKLLSWGLILQGPAWSFVELPRNGTQLGLRMNGQVSSSGQILP